MITPKPGDTVDVVIKGVRIVGERPDGTVVINCEDDRAHGVWPMPPQAAITPTSDQPPADTALQERVSDAIRAIDRMTDEQTLDAWPARAIREHLDPNPRHWPPQAGDVWDDGMPFGGSLWFAREYPAKPDDPDQTPKIGMVPETADRTRREGLTPHGLLESTPNFHNLTLVYRKRDEQ